MPFGGVVVVGKAVDGSWPMIETQAYAFAHRPAHEEPTLGFQAITCADEIPCDLEIESQLSSCWTK
jgi:hypothetical protein